MDRELVVCSGNTLMLFIFKYVRTQAPTSFAKDNFLLNYCLPSCLRNCNTEDSKVLGRTFYYSLDIWSGESCSPLKERGVAIK